VREELMEMRKVLREEMAAGFKTLGDKVEVHEARFSTLERKVA